MAVTSPLRLKGGFTSFAAAPHHASRTFGSSSSSSKGKVLAGMSMGRLRGGNSVASGLRMSSVAPSKSSNPPPAVVKGEGEMATQYDPQAVEQELYQWWEKSGYFQPTPYKEGEKKSYVLPMPPPNVTGGLHMGHAMFVALQDILARFHRMRGRPTLWLPGTDHAGIATQLLVERSVIAEGTTRQELGRDKFLERIWTWKGEKGGYITEQLRRLGASADWTRER